MKHIPRSPLSEIPADLVSLSDYERMAEQFIREDIYAYIAGGAADETSLRRNRSAFDAVSILPRVLTDCRQGGTQTQILSDCLRHPVMLAPVAFQQLVHSEGELATAQACSVLETAMVTSTLASRSLEAIADELDGPKWFQLYFQQDRDFTLSLVRRAESAGYSALMITVDAPLHGIRNRAQRAGFELPDTVQAVNLKDRPPLPSREFDPSQSIVFQGMMSEAPQWTDITWLMSQTSLPIVLKGVLSPADARLAQSIGVAAMVVSNHGGRTLDCVPAALDMLPAVRAVVGESFPLLLDGGIQRGTDVFKALALGADAVMIGRPQLYALAVAGALGVAHMLRLLREEFEVAMCLAGTATVKDIKRDCLWPLPT